MSKKKRQNKRPRIIYMRPKYWYDVAIVAEEQRGLLLLQCRKEENGAKTFRTTPVLPNVDIDEETAQQFVDIWAKLILKFR